MAECLRLEIPEDLCASAPDIQLVEPGPLGYVIPFTAREVVDDGHLVAAGEEMIRDVRADKPSAASKQDSHLSGDRALVRARMVGSLGEPLEGLLEAFARPHARFPA
jgi:hypothetical protein